MMATFCDILCIEGVPGSGKTTLAGNVQNRCASENIKSFWVVEEKKDHPITPAELRRLSNRDDFDVRCLRSWASFIDRLDQVAILDGCAFQSTVRFLLASDRSVEFIRHYVKRWEALLGDAKAKLVFLYLPDLLGEMNNRVFAIRGEDWVRKVSGYVAGTPYAIRKCLSGRQGMAKFWSQYQDLCLDLMAGLGIPVLQIQVSEENRGSLHDQVYSWAFERHS
ncbi:MAG: hypothetical protein HY787_27095 [Deltaproteobacteria bacterium]|nr:hypothetical protein [Deltaproteobacteria bacterium]